MRKDGRRRVKVARVDPPGSSTETERRAATRRWEEREAERDYLMDAVFFWSEEMLNLETDGGYTTS